MLGREPDPSATAEWERGANVPEGLRREHLIELLDGQRWPELRTATIVGEGLPETWDRGLRWYRRASRERGPRAAVGAVVAAILDDLRAIDSRDAHRHHYRERDGKWAQRVGARRGLSDKYQADLRRIEDAAYGLRWVELASGLRFDLSRLLVPQLRPTWLRGAAFDPAPHASVGPLSGR